MIMTLQAIKYTPSRGQSPPVLEVLDQLLLPHESRYEAVTTCEEAHDVIKQMKVRGAPAIAIVAALALAVESGTKLASGQISQSADETKELLSRRLEYLKTSRPTAVNLGDAVGKLKIVAKKAALQIDADGETVVEGYIRAAEQMLVDDVSDNKAIGEYGSKWIQEHTVAGKKGQGLKVLTHCNTGSLATAGYGTALGVIRSLREDHVLDHAFCSETRPYNQGSRLTAYELVHDQIPATLITDSMVASLLLREGEKIAAVVVGADRVAANGDTANKIGTYSLAVLAKHHGVKFLVAAPRTTIDLHTTSGKDIVIEQRASNEVTSIRGPQVGSDGSVDVDKTAIISIAARGIEVWNPAFDVTPAELIDGVITEVGVVEKANGIFDFKRIFATA